MKSEGQPALMASDNYLIISVEGEAAGAEMRVLDLTASLAWPKCESLASA